MLRDLSAADVDLSVRFKPVSGRVDQAAGLVWRFQNEDNYYIVRANALENNVVLYKVENGKRTDLPVKGEGRTYGKKAQVPSGQWSTLRVVAAGPRFEVYFNGSKLYEVEDTTFSQAGKVGVWTKADSVTQFDDLTVAPGSAMARSIECRRLTPSHRARPRCRGRRAGHREPAECRPDRHDICVDRSGVLGTRAPRVRATIGCQGQCGVRHGRNEVDRVWPIGCWPRTRGRKPTCSGRTSRSARWC